MEAWELHFGAGFLLAQKASLGSGSRLPGTASVPQWQEQKRESNVRD
jgi:hypothetical protein